MKKNKNFSAKKMLRSLEIKSVSKNLTGRQKEVIKLLQMKEVIIIDHVDNKKEVFVTCGNNAKKITPHLFYNLIVKDLVQRQAEWPFNYVLSATGEIIKV